MAIYAVCMRLAGLASFLLMAWSSAAGAQVRDEDFCRNGLFTIVNAPIGLARVIGTSRAWFLEDMDGCPNAEARCRQQAYVVPGDRVLVGNARGNYLCVYYPSRGGGTAGWMDAARLRRIESEPNPPLSAWVGRWSDEGDPRIRIARRGRRLTVEGEAFWPSRNPSAEQFPGGPNVGRVDEPLEVTGNAAHARECNISFVLLGDYLVGADPDRSCGGMNVSFSGVYRRKRR